MFELVPEAYVPFQSVLASADPPAPFDELAARGVCPPPHATRKKTRPSRPTLQYAFIGNSVCNTGAVTLFGPPFRPILWDQRPRWIERNTIGALRNLRHYIAVR